MASNTLNVDIQVMLRKDGYYDGAVDGKFGPETYDAIALAVQESGVKTKGWNKARLFIAAEQLLYTNNKIPVGAIDGLNGHVTNDARDTYQAKSVLNFREKVEERVDEGAVMPTPVKTRGLVVPVREWPRQRDCKAFYGAVGTNQDEAVMPYTMVLAWEQKQKVTKFSCHKLVKAPIERIFQRTLDHYGYEKIKELGLHLWGGCLNVRKMRGGSSWSMHSWGIAVDMDPDNNQLKWGRDRATFAKPAYNKYWEFVYDEGAISLGKERNYDFMHFQFSKL